MASRAESPEGKSTGGGVVMEFPSGDGSSFSSPPALPRRLRRRLHAMEYKSPVTVEEIEAKLRDADLRRQQFYERLSSKARPRPRSPPYSSSSQEEDAGQRLEAKLQAAEQKRLSILAKAQTRLARLNKLRQAAKTGVEMRYERERVKLGTKVDSRVQRAEANRMHMLKACRQRRATISERSSQSLVQRMARERKYKERVCAAIHQKRAAAEAKRMGLLEEEKKKAHARLMRVRHVAKFISHQHEFERKKMRDQLEDRLQRAKRQRAEYLKQRVRMHGFPREKGSSMYKQAEVFSMKLTRCWRQFVSQKKTTYSLAKAWDALQINRSSVKSMPFEQLALLIESISTLQTVKALLDRIEVRLKVSKAVAPIKDLYNLDNIDHLLQRVASPKKRTTPRSHMRNREAKKLVLRESSKGIKFARYPVRIVLCSFMILGHPDAVLSGSGVPENALAKCAEKFVQEFKLLVKIILEGPILACDEKADMSYSKHQTFRSQLTEFDKAWCSYLNSFVVWKVKDAQSLEEDLVRAACQLEVSMMQTCKLTPERDSGALTHDMKAVQKQVTEDQRLLRDKVQHLSGDAGIARMESALSETRSKYFKLMEKGISLGSPLTHFMSPASIASNTSPPVSSNEKICVADHNKKSSRVVRSLFRENDASSSRGSSASLSVGHLSSSIQKFVTENEILVNEYLHEQSFNVAAAAVMDQNLDIIKVKIKGTMEKAYWDGIMASIEQEPPDYDRVIQLMVEVRDEICEIAPKSWKVDIYGAIDLEILTQVLKSGNLDVDYLGRILEFSLVTLQRLSAPANEDLMKASHQKLFLELNEIYQSGDGSNKSCVTALVKGLRFVLEQIQILKQEIRKARIKLMEPLLKGPAGLDYLRNVFANRFGSPSDACTSLPITVSWLSFVRNCKDQEWEEHRHLLCDLTNDNSSQELLPPTVLKTGGSRSHGSQHVFSSADASPPVKEQPECKGETVDLLVRLGLLKLAIGVSGLTPKELPETFFLNLTRLRTVQAQIQNIIVISTSVLIWRQILVSEQVTGKDVDMESMALKCVERLYGLFDHVEDAGIGDIVEVVCDFSEISGTAMVTQQLHSIKEVTSRLLAKSLQPGDTVFEKVSQAVYLAARGVVLGGSGVQGRKLAEMALRKVGAIVLTEKVVEAAKILVVAASISVGVHGPWYSHLIETAN